MDRVLRVERALETVRTSVLLGAIDWRDALLDSGVTADTARYLTRMQEHQAVCAASLAGIRRDDDPPDGAGVVRGARTRGRRRTGTRSHPSSLSRPSRGPPTSGAIMRDRVIPKRANIVRIVAQVQSLNRAQLSSSRQHKADVVCPVANPLPADGQPGPAAQPRRRRTGDGLRDTPRTRPAGASHGERAERRRSPPPVGAPRAGAGGRAAPHRARTARRSRAGADGGQDAARHRAPVGAAAGDAAPSTRRATSSMPRCSRHGNCRGCCIRRCSTTWGWAPRSTGTSGVRGTDRHRHRVPPCGTG